MLLHLVSNTDCYLYYFTGADNFDEQVDSIDVLRQKLLAELETIKNLKFQAHQHLLDLGFGQTTTAYPKVQRRVMEFLGKRVSERQQLPKRRMEFLGK